jgi:hypothetical protein
MAVSGGPVLTDSIIKGLKDGKASLHDLLQSWLHVHISSVHAAHADSGQ